MQQLAGGHVGERAPRSARCARRPRVAHGRRASPGCEAEPRRAARRRRRGSGCRSRRSAARGRPARRRRGARDGQLERAQLARRRSASPTSASGSPAASAAATGAKMSRPWNVRETGCRRSGESPMSTASTHAAEPLGGGHQQPVVGPHEQASCRGRAQRHAPGARARRRADAGIDDREVHARRACSGSARAQHERAGAHVVAGDPVGEVDHPRAAGSGARSPRGRRRRTRRWTVVGQERDQRDVRLQRAHRARAVSAPRSREQRARSRPSMS